MPQLLDALVEVVQHCGLPLAWLGQRDELDEVDQCPTAELRAREEASVVEVVHKRVEVGVQEALVSVLRREDALIHEYDLLDGVTQRQDAPDEVEELVVVAAMLLQ